MQILHNIKKEIWQYEMSKVLTQGKIAQGSRCLEGQRKYKQDEMAMSLIFVFFWQEYTIWK